jgi:hypothetical protein
MEPEEQRRAHARAAELGISFAEYVRRLVAQDLGQEVRGPTSPEAIFDLGDSGGSHVAREKDRYLGDAIESLR